MQKYVIGLNFGTNGACALIVNSRNGEILATSEKAFPRWSQGKYCNPKENQWRHHPLDYLEVMEQIVVEALAQCPDDVRQNVVSIALNATGSTPVLTDDTGTPLALLEGFEENPNAMFLLWKDHTAVSEANEINALCKKWHTDYTKFVGGVYSAEWFWAKVMHVMREDDYVASKARSIVEACEWLPAVLTGVRDSAKIIRSRCVYGHKVLWHEEWGGLPPEEFLVTLDSRISGYRLIIPKNCFTAEHPVGTLCKEWAEKFGLRTDVVIAGGAFDSHMGAVGAGITPNTLVRLVGDSTCDIMVAQKKTIDNKCIKGICGQVEGSVLPGMIGLEAGQSSFGDLFNVFGSVLDYGIKVVMSEILNDKLPKNEAAAIIEKACKKLLPTLAAAAEGMTPEESTMVATEWVNGRRSPDADFSLTGTVSGVSLNTTAPMIFRTLIEATAFGTKAIVDRFEQEGIVVDDVIAIGDLALRSDFLMKTICDVINKPIKISNTNYASALGAAMFAATAAGIYDDIQQAIAAMNSGFSKEYFPNKEMVKYYQKKYARYAALGRYSETMKPDMGLYS